MPGFEHSNFSRKSAASAHAYSYDKILAIFNPNPTADNSVFARNNKYSVMFKDNSGYHFSVSTSPSGVYQKMAGCDLSVIFAPFESRIGPQSGMPGFSSLATNGWSIPSGNNYINFQHVLPFRYEPNSSAFVYDRWSAASGDALSDVISGDQNYADFTQYRDTSNIRSMGLRLPLMGVGWGFTLDGRSFPSGQPPVGAPASGTYWKGGLDHGWQLDPSDYVAAPIDLRYDTDRNVWTCGGGDSLPKGTGRFKVLMLMDEQSPGTPGWDYPRFHSSIS